MYDFNIKMPLGDTPMTYPFPYKTADGGDNTIKSSILSKLTLTSTEQTSGFTDNTGALIVYGGAQFQSDIWVNGNIYVAGKVYQSSFTPELVANSGTLGSITYQKQTGVYNISADEKTVVYSINIIASFTGSVNCQIGFSGLPSVCASIPTCTSNVEFKINDIVQGPVGIYMGESSTNPYIIFVTGDAPLIDGNGTLSLLVSTAYCTSTAASTFTPSLSSGSGSIGTVSYSTQSGIYSSMGSAIISHIKLIGTYLGSSSTQLRISGFPAVSSSNIIQYAGANNPSPFLPTALEFDNSNIAPIKNLIFDYPLSGSGSFDYKGSAIFLDTTVSSSFTPSIAGNNLGPITYSIQKGYSYKTLQCVFYAIELQFSFTTATEGSINISGFPYKCGILDSITKQLTCSFENPIKIILKGTTQTAEVYNDGTNNTVTLNGTGSNYYIKFTGTYLSLS